MAPVSNPCYRLISRPSGYPDPVKNFQYDTSGSIDPDTIDLKGGFLMQTQFLSVDPYMRGRMDEGTFDAWELGNVFMGYGISEVIRSEIPEFQEGDILYGIHRFEHYTIHEGWEAQTKKWRVIHNFENLPLSVYLGVAGMPGKTAYYGMKAIGQPKAGESIFVSTAAGVVGQTVCQLSKAWGLKVLGSTGSDDKVKFLQEDIHVDHAFNYKNSSTADEVKLFGGLDIFWDNVGGQILDIALANMKSHGRIIICGQIARYNGENPYGIKNVFSMVYNEVTMKGLYVNSYEEQYSEEFYSTVPKMIADGKMKYTEEVVVGLEHAGDLLVKVLKGQIMGKVVLQMWA
ncbi:NADP-binding protein [Dacryopinax primogenitus]|uniref:NADP-binding protein n=1 Tax=Dacryopinax primogenitus (strain DJM 731) TaxID=1858805 RepID=M5G771_DACPD|nr:NADP-binding protein [Dacryopinax primogenitus]EJU01662.1 NADP-binding protein [Dacryopinax primogenitus]